MECLKMFHLKGTYLIVIIIHSALGNFQINKNYSVIPTLPSGYDYIVNAFKQVAESQNKSSLCYRHLQAIFEGLTNFELWALQIVDSWGRIPNSILEGNSFSFGNFDECLKVTKELKNSNEELTTQYCLPTILVDPKLIYPDLADMFENRKLGIGTCFPAECNVSNIQIVIQDKIYSNWNFSKQLIFDDYSCYSNESEDFNTIEWFASILFSIIGILCVLSTIYDSIQQYRQKNSNQLLISFSLLTNGMKLFKLREKRSVDEITCLDGMRCISIMWVIYAHCYIIMMSDMFYNQLAVINASEKFLLMVIFSGSISVDTFFLISGLLVIWFIMKHLEKGNRFNIPMMYVHRYLRLTVTYAFVILFTLSLMRRCGSGPNWNYFVELFKKPCEDYWWSALLYVQNYVNPRDVCLPYSWYLSVDTQLFFLSPLIIIPLMKWHKIVRWILVIPIIASMATVFAIYMINDYSFRFNKEGQIYMVDRAVDTYYPTHTRFSPWLIGVVFGFYLFPMRKEQIKLPKRLIIMGWIISLGTMIAGIYGPFPAFQRTETVEGLESGLFESLRRVSWAIAVCWVIFACMHGHGGLINTFLSYPLWQPFSRLSYCVYMLHQLLQVMYMGSQRQNLFHTEMEKIKSFWGDLGLSLLASTLLHLAVEVPFGNIETNLLTPKRKPKTIEETVSPGKLVNDEFIREYANGQRTQF